MSFGITAAQLTAGAAVGALGLSAYNTFAGPKGGKFGGIDVSLPDFWKDPYYDKTQSKLFDFGSDLMEGEVPDYYKPLGEYGGKEFEDLMRLVERDTTRSVMESASRRNQQGGNVTTAVAQQVADARTKLSYEDFVRAMGGRELFFKAGPAAISDVGSKALTNQAQKNQFELNKAQLQLSGQTAGANYAMQQGNQWADLVGSGLSGIGTAAGMYYGLKGGQTGGGSLGSAGSTGSSLKDIDYMMAIANQSGFGR